MIEPYLEQLRALAAQADVELLAAFKKAGVPTSTYYRVVNGRHALSYQTAEAVADAIRRTSGPE